MTAALASSIRSFIYFFIRSFLLSATLLCRFFCERISLLWLSPDDMILKRILTQIYKYLERKKESEENDP